MPVSLAIVPNSLVARQRVPKLFFSYWRWACKQQCITNNVLCTSCLTALPAVDGQGLGPGGAFFGRDKIKEQQKIEKALAAASPAAAAPAPARQKRPAAVPDVSPSKRQAVEWQADASVQVSCDLEKGGTGYYPAVIVRQVRAGGCARVQCVE